MFLLPLPSPSPSSNLVPRRQKREKERVHVTICFDWLKMWRLIFSANQRVEVQN